VDARQRQDLARYITGNYGEDQFEGIASVDAGTSVHFDYCERPNAFYDPADDGPETRLITRILAADWYYEIERERLPNSYPEAAL